MTNADAFPTFLSQGVIEETEQGRGRPRAGWGRTEHHLLGRVGASSRGQIEEGTAWIDSTGQG